MCIRDSLIFDLKTPLKVASLYDADDLPRIDIVKALNDAVNLIDFNTCLLYTSAAELAPPPAMRAR